MTETDPAVFRFLGGDEAAFTQIVQEWQVRVYNLAWRFLGNREDAQDATQDTFLAVFRSLKGLRDPRSFPTWLYRIALNQCRAKWRHRTPELSLEEPIPGRGDEEPIEPQVADGRSDVASTFEAKDLVCKALLKTSEEHRTAIILKEYVGLSLGEVAEVMGCPLSTAKSRLYHGLRGVQRNLRRLGARF
jgi:RNA polymerase sigma-70 factor (ECF subfamily)